jgi:glutamate racemase
MIGVFDSGVGGLTVLKALRDVYPSVDVAYFGDIRNAPYGARSRTELSRLAVDGAQFLIDKGASSIVCACNSVSVSMALSLYDILSVPHIPIIEMVGPCVAALRGSEARILLVATSATVESGMYQNAFRMIGKEIQAMAIPELASAIECGEGNAAYETCIRAALADVPADSYDMLVLGCTHFPLARESFHAVVGDKALFDPAEAVASRVLRDLWPREMGYGKTAFYISKESARFRALAEKMFPQGEYAIQVVA